MGWRTSGLRALAVGLPFALLLTGPPPAAQNRVVLLATTTSTQDSGLLDLLVPLFENQTGYTVKTIAVGTGQSLAMGARGEADVVLAHAPALEQQYVAEGSLTSRRPIMHNDFILVGPASDPAGTRQAPKAVDAFRRIAAAPARFVSRGDNSGTHHRERALWKAAGLTPGGAWYLESGQGMGATLIIASEKDAYTLTDRGTYLAFLKRLRLTLLLEGDAPLRNSYHVLEVNPARHPKVNGAGGKAFADFLVSAEAQEVIRTFGVERYGQPLFFPDAKTTTREGG